MFNEFDAKSYALPRTGVEFSSSRPELKRVFDDCERLLKDNIKVYNGRRVLIEGSNYRNVWLETQPMGGEMYAKRDVEVGLNNLLIFMQYQRRDGRMPGMISDMSDRMLGVVAHYDWIQGFYFAHQALRMCDWIGPDERYLRLVAGAMEDFYGYIMKYRTGNPNGIPEEWCVWDSGEDNCARFLRLGARDGGFGGETPPQDSGRLPFQSMEYAGYCYDMAATPTPKPTATPTPKPTATPEPTAVPTSIPESAFAPIRTDLTFPETPTTDKAALGVTHSYRSEADNLAVMQLQGYAYIDDASFDGSTAQLYLVLKRESNGARAVALTTMKSGVSGVDHADAQCANASACDFEIFLSTASLPDDIYSLGMVIQYKVGGADKFEYVEFPETCTFTVLNRQFLGDVALTD